MSYEPTHHHYSGCMHGTTALEKHHEGASRWAATSNSFSVVRTGLALCGVSRHALLPFRLLQLPLVCALHPACTLQLSGLSTTRKSTAMSGADIFGIQSGHHSHPSRLEYFSHTQCGSYVPLTALDLHQSFTSSVRQVSEAYDHHSTGCALCPPIERAEGGPTVGARGIRRSIISV